MSLLHSTGVACVPGEAFYHDDSGENLGRFCFAKGDSILEEACRRLERLKIRDQRSEDRGRSLRGRKSEVRRFLEGL